MKIICHFWRILGFVLSFLVVVQYDLVFHTKVEIVTCLTLSKNPNNHLSFCLPSCPVLGLAVQCGRQCSKSEFKVQMSPYNSMKRFIMYRNYENFYFFEIFYISIMHGLIVNASASSFFTFYNRGVFFEINFFTKCSNFRWFKKWLRRHFCDVSSIYFYLILINSPYLGNLSLGIQWVLFLFRNIFAKIQFVW